MGLTSSPLNKNSLHDYLMLFGCFQRQKVMAKGGSAAKKPIKQPKPEAVARLRAAIQSLTKSQIANAPGDFVAVRLEVDDDTDVAELIGAFFGTVAEQKAKQAALMPRPKTVMPKVITSTVKSQKVFKSNRNSM